VTSYFGINITSEVKLESVKAKHPQLECPPTLLGVYIHREGRHHLDHCSSGICILLSVKCHLSLDIIDNYCFY